MESSPDDVNWWGGFAPNGVGEGGLVYAAAVYDGRLYVCGIFS